jgi:hypothetical protein
MSDQHTDEVAEPAWDLGEEAPREFRNAAWQLLGQTRKRDVFLAVREMVGDGALQAATIGRTATRKPHFDDDASPDLSDNGDLDALCRLLVGFPIPKVARPEHWYFVPFEPMCEYLVNPFHAPANGSVRAAIEYLRVNDPVPEVDIDDADRGGVETDGDGDPVPVDMFATEAHTYVRLAAKLDCVAPKVTFREFRPDDFGGQVGKGFVVEGSLVAEEMDRRQGVTDSDVKHTLHRLFTEYVEHATPEWKNIFQIGLYQTDDEEHTKRDARIDAISDRAGFEVFEPAFDDGHLLFRWKTEPVIIT